jgi:3'-phosphoadenosine 5'-phosphosulfate sulfotransferase (PAPS reductase)/FAD synthetase
VLIVYSFDVKKLDWNSPNRSKEAQKMISDRGFELSRYQKQSLKDKITSAQARIEYVYNEYKEEEVYLSFSGGKDSTVLSHLCLEMGVKPLHVYVDTRLERRDCRKFARKWCDDNKIELKIIRSDVKPLWVWKNYGYPIFSKAVSGFVEELNNNGKACKRRNEKYMKKWGFLKGIPLSSKCCDYLKKKPIKKFLKNNPELKVSLVGVMASESMMRELAWIQKGCIYFQRNMGLTTAHPLSFWFVKDIWNYIKNYNVPISDTYKFTDRNGCFCCGFGCDRINPNTFQILYRYNRKLWKNVLDKWGFREILDRCGVKYKPDGCLDDWIDF